MAPAQAPARLPFFKFEGLGNDFLVFDLRDPQFRDAGRDIDPAVASLRARARTLCDRRFGVGGDGLLLVVPSSDPQCHAQMIVINADGSRPEMCGNGLRCVAHFLDNTLNAGTVSPNDEMPASDETPRTLWVLTDNGPLRCEVHSQDPQSATVRVDMGPARVGATHQHEAAPGLSFLSVNMGNPHAVTFVNPDQDPETLAKSLGPSLECNPAYPDKTNVEFVKDTGDSLLCWVWERGCGITMACGTGACATAVASVQAKLRDPGKPITVQLPGGSLEIIVAPDPQASVSMRGPSRWVFEGSIPRTA